MTRQMNRQVLEQTDGPALVDPAPDTLVYAPERARPGLPVSAIPRFSAMSWQLAGTDRRESGSSKVIRWDRFPLPLLASFKRCGWALLNLPTPAVLLSRPHSTTRPRVSPATAGNIVGCWLRFATWLSRQEITSLDQVNADLLSEYASDLPQTSYNTTIYHLLAITRLWAYAPYFLPCDRIPMPPWDEEGIDAYLDSRVGRESENKTAPIHPSVMSPLVVWAIRVVTDFAPDILAAYREARRIKDAIPVKAVKGGRQALDAYLRQLRASGQPLPTLKSRTVSMVTARAGRGDDTTGWRPVHRQFIAGVVGVSVRQVGRVLSSHEAAEGLALGDGAPLRTPVTARIGDEPWFTPEFDEARAVAVHLSTAALVTIAYLSGMRPVVLHLERGCRRVDQPEGSCVIRYRLVGRHFKGVLDAEGTLKPEGEIRAEPWTVLKVVHQAVEVLEELGDERLLFPRNFSEQPRQRDHLGAAVTPQMAAQRIERFTRWANQLAARHGLAHELIPSDPVGRVSLRRFRRTVAWFINRQPGGRLALGVQYGHLHLTMSDSYGGRSTSDMLDVLALERAYAIADTLQEAAERLREGEGVSGPAAGRFIAAVSEFERTYPGGFLSKRQAKALLGNPRLQVFADPEALLICNKDPAKALCDPGRGSPGHRPPPTPSHDRCQRACANIARTDSLIQQMREEVSGLNEEIADGINPRPVELRLRQRRDVQQAAIDRHEATRVTARPES